MEFEILNDILTSTVGRIFPDPKRCLNYFKFEEEIIKNEIPKSSNRDRENNISIYRDLNVHQNSKKKEVDLQDAWMKGGDKKRLEEALQRLGIDENRCKNKNLVNFGLDYLLSEKSKVKSELKKFDNDFLEIFQRLPNRNEKEVMRIIYMYYKNLKQAITYKQTQGNIEKNNKHESFNDINNQLNLTPQNNIHTENKKTPTLNNNYLNKQKSNSNDFSNNYSKNTYNKSEKEDSNLFHNNFQVKPEKKKNLSFNVQSKLNLQELEKEYELLKKQQVTLKQTLHNYQKEFYEIHNRRVKYYKDIIGVEEDYQKYKENKMRLNEIQETLQQYKNTK